MGGLGEIDAVVEFDGLVPVVDAGGPGNGVIAGDPTTPVGRWTTYIEGANALGKDGYELVAVQRDQSGQTWIFKR